MLLRDDRELENGFLARAVGGDDAGDLSDAERQRSGLVEHDDIDPV